MTLVRFEGKDLKSFRIAIPQLPHLPPFFRLFAIGVERFKLSRTKFMRSSSHANCLNSISFCGDREIRTLTVLLLLAPEASASANSAISPENWCEMNVRIYQFRHTPFIKLIFLTPRRQLRLQIIQL